MVNYMKFMHKVINFVSISSKGDVNSLVEALKKNLLEEIELF